MWAQWFGPAGKGWSVMEFWAGLVVVVKPGSGTCFPNLFGHPLKGKVNKGKVIVQEEHCSRACCYVLLG